MAGHPVLGPLGGAWGAMRAAVGDPVVRAQPGGIQQYVWQSISNDFLSRGEAIPPGAFQAVNRGISLAAQQYRSEQNLSRALAGFARTGIDQSISAQDHIAPSIDARPLDQLPLGPTYRVTYLTSTLVGGEPLLHYETWVSAYPPESLSGLADAVTEAAQFQAADYNFEWLGVATPVSIQAY